MSATQAPTSAESDDELITYSFMLYLQHGRHDVICKPSIRKYFKYNDLYSEIYNLILSAKTFSYASNKKMQLHAVYK